MMNSFIKTENPPIILIGMHRSGTTMVASMLQQLGLFIGEDLDENSESMFFVNHNDWMFRQCGGSWDNPNSIQWLYQNSEIMGLTDDYIKERISSVTAISYIGLKRFILGIRPLSGMKGKVWGWKDPRNTFTLRFWLRLFPGAKVIHIYRNGVPVAASLRARERRLLMMAMKRHHLRMLIGIYKLISKKSGFIWSNRCLTLEGGYTLWEEYVKAAMNSMSIVGDNGYSLKYEEFLSAPVKYLSDLVSFCGIEVSKERIKEIASQVRPGRGEAHESDDELSRFGDSVRQRPLMIQLGYDGKVK